VVSIYTRLDNKSSHNIKGYNVELQHDQLHNRITALIRLYVSVLPSVLSSHLAPSALVVRSSHVALSTAQRRLQTDQLPLTADSRVQFTFSLTLDRTSNLDLNDA